MAVLKQSEKSNFYSIDAIYERYIARFGAPDSKTPVRKTGKISAQQIKENLLNPNPVQIEIKKETPSLLAKTSIQQSLDFKTRTEKYECIFSTPKKEKYGCKYPLDGSGIDICYCEQTRKAGSQFCEEHHAICRPYKKSLAIPSERVLYQGLEENKKKEDRVSHIAIDIEIRNNRNIVDHYNLYD